MYNVQIYHLRVRYKSSRYLLCTSRQNYCKNFALVQRPGEKKGFPPALPKARPIYMYSFSK